jgi:hypothetical protein
MEDKYVFKDKDLTTDILFKIEEIVSILTESENISFDEAYALFISSKTYGSLLRTNNLLWAESAEFLADEYFREKNNT